MCNWIHCTRKLVSERRSTSWRYEGGIPRFRCVGRGARKLACAARIRQWDDEASKRRHDDPPHAPQIGGRGAYLETQHAAGSRDH